MSKETEDIKHTLKFFSEFKSTDPKIIVNDSTIELIPFYGSFGFIINFIPLLASTYILVKQNELIVNLLCISAIIISLFNM
ncbi:MAG: hypothetical protein JWN83_237 [Chitinophagaceae bacterium]|nr:hypothetical protein [Chitinophagaceae bacterium]